MSIQALSFMLAAGLLAAAPGVAGADGAPARRGVLQGRRGMLQRARQRAARSGAHSQRIVNRLEPTSRQTMTVWFHRPVKIGDRILLGQYVIEHDTVRMARNRPCTYIYAASDQRLPVVAFHCTHLKRARGGAIHRRAAAAG